jgi:TonB family protein
MATPAWTENIGKSKLEKSDKARRVVLYFQSPEQKKIADYLLDCRHRIEVLWNAERFKDIKSHAQYSSVACTFILEKSGAVANLKIKDSSGLNNIDQTALKVIRQASFQAHPDLWQDEGNVFVRFSDDAYLKVNMIVTPDPTHTNIVRWVPQDEQSPTVKRIRAEFFKFQGRMGEFLERGNLFVDKLVAGDSEGAMELMAGKLEYIKDASVEDVLTNELIPFFSDFKERGKETSCLELRENGKWNGFAIYRIFETASGTKKNYMLKLMLRDDKPTITAVILNRKLADDAPDLAESIEKASPHVEIIKPSNSKQVIWSAPSNK